MKHCKVQNVIAASGDNQKAFETGLDHMTSITRSFIDLFKTLTAEEMAAGKVMGNWSSFEIFRKAALELTQ